ncbi:MAG: bifunctional nuclease domain-containing protein [Acidobacteriota bacterium]
MNRILGTLLLSSALACAPALEEPVSPPPETPSQDVPAPVDGDYLSAEVAKVAWDGLSETPMVLVRDLEFGRVMPIWVSPSQGQAILQVINDLPSPRPSTHDVMARMLTRLDATMVELLIHDLVENSYFALIRLRSNQTGDTFLLDARPSDGIALALRVEAPIRISRQLLEEAPDFELLAPESEEGIARGLGLTVVEPTDDLRQKFALPKRSGLVITRAVDRAADKGLRRGDLLTEMGGKSTTTPDDFLDVLRIAPLDRPLVLKIWRAGEELEFSLEPIPPGDEPSESLPTT